MSASLHRQFRPRAFFAAILILLISGCGLPINETVGTLFEKPVSISAARPPLSDLNEEPQPYRYPDMAREDGSITRIMWVRVGAGDALEASLKGVPEWEGVEKTLSKKTVVKDPNADQGAYKEWAQHAGLESIILRGDLASVDACADIIENFLSSVPNVLIEARVVEVVESDDFALGFDFFVLNREDFPLDPADYNAPLDPTKTVFNRSRVGSGIPNLPGVVGSGFIPNLLVELGTIKDDLQIDLLISALSQLTKIDVVNAPNVAVRSGHIASIAAGEEVPYFTVNVSGANQTVSTKFKKVAVNLAVLPTVTGRSSLSLAVKLSVENITGISTVATGGATTSNPIISSRGVTTTMDVKDGATVVLGGLITTNDIEVDERVPLLGDIPLLGHLFRNQRSQESRSNLLFFLRPKIITPNDSGDTEIILPPEDNEIIGPDSPGVVLPPIGEESGDR